MVGRKVDRNWEKRRKFSTCWNGAELMLIPFSKVLEENEPVRSLYGQLKDANLVIGVTKLRDEPRITESSGELRVSLADRWSKQG